MPSLFWVPVAFVFVVAFLPILIVCVAAMLAIEFIGYLLTRMTPG